ncbi:TRAM domain-containing protein [Natrinema caseinilyticum]|uniref:TRAM domain-containing protein n=1 Tax=Natrinema caseinilyticum TaxID=2961570 RepID=UPI0020C30C9E|nr:TRAM domain-containing protein [Natrinema caseinilyticum]
MYVGPSHIHRGYHATIVIHMGGKSPELVCKFAGKIEKRGTDHLIEIPDTEIDYGSLSAGDIVRVSIETTEQDVTETPQEKSTGPVPPVREGETLTVEIEDRGDQGDGIARVDRGYVLIVPETEPGDEATVRVTQTNPSYGFAQTVNEQSGTNRR